MFFFFVHNSKLTTHTTVKLASHSVLHSTVLENLPFNHNTNMDLHFQSEVTKENIHAELST